MPTTPPEPAPATIRRLALRCEHRRTLVDDRTALTNRLGATLKGYYPLALTTVAQLAALQPILADYDQPITVIFFQHANHGCFAALPGAGPVLGPRLAAAFGTLPDQWRSPRACRTTAAWLR